MTAADTFRQRLPVIDGMRAFAVLAVVLFHGFEPWFSGGYVGVDVFLVLSGFVIALRYLEPMVAREIDYPTFFLRRVRRLVPAYFATLAVTTLFAAYVMGPKDLVRFGYSLISQAFYAQNIMFWLQGDYFDGALTKPLLHTWSLAIEEQFYLCFPLLVAALRWRRTATVAACIFVVLTTVWASAFVENVSPKTAFYWLPFRAWEFLAGIAAAALFRRGFGQILPAAAANALGLSALAALFAAVFLFDEDNASVLTQGLLAVTGSFALCLAQNRISPALAAVFTNRLAQHFGRISYSWYLWHWPPLALGFLILRRPATPLESLALTLLGYALALLSWRLLERGVLQSTWLAKPSRTMALLLAFLLFAAGTGTALVASDGFVARYPPWARPLLRAQMDRPDGRCPLATRLWHLRRQTCPINDIGGGGGILFIGDSHLEMKKNALAALGTRYRIRVFIAQQNCRIIDFGIDRNCGWRVWRGLERDIRENGITRVVIIAHWAGPFDRTAFDAAIAKLTAAGVRVVLERPTPDDGALAPASYLARGQRWGAVSGYSLAAHEASQRSINQAISERAAHDPQITVLDPAPLLCPAGQCLFAQGDEPLYSDTHHLTGAGVRRIVPIYRPLFEMAARERRTDAAR